MSVRWNISVTTILLIIGVVIIFIVRPFSCHPKPSHFDWTSIHTWLESHQYTQADPVSDPILPDSVPIPDEAVITTVTGSGTWIPTETYTPEDTLEVELTEVTLGDGSHWVKLTIDSVEVKWQRLQHYKIPPPARRWTGFVEFTNCESSHYGVGIGYKLFDVLSVDVSPAVSVSTRLDWIAGEVQLTRTIWSGISGGFGVGCRSNGELHISGLINIEL